ncbi:hypothetical protein [Ferrovibrio terrae]|uniref:hypothetical protein n=1 Tax=Ferrovibrio terrae TaxID=2594003 RepID=UPI0031382006
MARTPLQRLLQNITPIDGLSCLSDFSTLVEIDFCDWPGEALKSCWIWNGRMSRATSRVFRATRKSSRESARAYSQLLIPRPTIQVQVNVAILDEETLLPTGVTRRSAKRISGARYCWGVIRPHEPLHRLHELRKKPELCRNALCVNPFHHRIHTLADHRWEGLKPDEQALNYIPSAHDDIADLTDLLFGLKESGFHPESIDDILDKLPDFTASEIALAVARGRLKSWANL